MLWRHSGDNARSDECRATLLVRSPGATRPALAHNVDGGLFLRELAGGSHRLRLVAGYGLRALFGDNSGRLGVGEPVNARAARRGCRQGCSILLFGNLNHTAESITEAPKSLDTGG